MPSDRQRWNKKFSRGDHGADQPSSLITSIAEYVPRRGRALDVAGGAGRHALWLAGRGLEVTLVDVSDVALQLARERAVAAALPLRTVQSDLLHEPLPPGPWDVILSVHFLHRPLYKQFANFLAANGIVVVLQPTKKNLERHSKPPAEYLLNEGELPTLLEGLSIIHYREGWLEEGRHEALLVAQRWTEEAQS